MSEQFERRPFELHFRIGSIPVVVEPAFWFISALFGLAGLQAGGFHVVLLWMGIVFFSILIHELGHAVTARLFGSSSYIRLHGFGGLTFHERLPGRWRPIAISLAGPGAGFLFGGVVLLLEFLNPPRTPLAALFILNLKWVNFGWGIINLLPVPPLDGGHVLEMLLGEKRRRWAFMIGGLFGAAAAVLFGYLNLLWPALLFGMFAFRNFQAANMLRHLPEQAATPEEQFGQTLVEVLLQGGWKALSSGDEREAERIGMLAFEQASTPELRNRARDLMAWARMAGGEHARALALLDESEPVEATRALSRAMALEALERREEAVTFALRAVEEEPSDSSAGLALRLLVALGRVDEAEALASRFPWKRAGGEPAARARVALARGEFGDAAVLWQQAFERSGSPEEAYNAACSHARARQLTDAIAWIERALDAGFRDLDALRADPDLAEIREAPELQRLLDARAAG